MTSTVERTAAGAVITGFEYTYDDLSRIIEEKVLANSTKMCYTYDNLSRVTARTVKKLSDNSVVSTETFNYDAAGNVTSAPDSSFQYDTNNRLISFNGNTVSYDLDGNMLSNGSLACTYDSGNRLITAGGHTYTYDAADIRIRNLCAGEDTTYTYDPHAKLSRLLCKTTNGVVTKYVYGRGLIGEEVSGTFKTYHFDYRGSTIAITNASGNITDTFAYDTYGKLLSRTGTNKVIFGYNGRDGVVTDDNGLIYMRARYYSPTMKRFINADVVAGAISNAITLNRFAYANGNPVSFVDPFGLWSLKSAWNGLKNWVKEEIVNPAVDFVKEKIVDPAIDAAKTTFKNIENLYLKAEASWSDVYNTTFNNHEENLKYDVKNDIIYDQDTVCEDIKLGDHTMPYAGCEVIAVYNARILLGYADVSLADTIEQFANCGALTMQPVLRGGFGGNPFSIGKVLKAENLKYSTIESFEQMKGTPGVYIVSVWNSNDFDSMIHTIAIEIVDGEEPRMINGDFNMDSTTEDIFITGYKVSRK